MNDVGCGYPVFAKAPYPYFFLIECVGMLQIESCSTCGKLD